MSTFKVWIGVEEFDPTTDKYIDIDLPIAATAVFDNEKDAVDFAMAMHNTAIDRETTK